MKTNVTVLVICLAALIVNAGALGGPPAKDNDKKKEDPKAAIKIHWTNVGAYTYSWKADLENTDNHRKVAVVVKCWNDKDPTHPVTKRYEMHPQTFQTVGMFVFNNGVTVVDAKFLE